MIAPCRHSNNQLTVTYSRRSANRRTYGPQSRIETRFVELVRHRSACYHRQRIAGGGDCTLSEAAGGRNGFHRCGGAQGNCAGVNRGRCSRRAAVGRVVDSRGWRTVGDGHTQGRRKAGPARWRERRCRRGRCRRCVLKATERRGHGRSIRRIAVVVACEGSKVGHHQTVVEAPSRSPAHCIRRPICGIGRTRTLQPEVGRHRITGERYCIQPDILYTGVNAGTQQIHIRSICVGIVVDPVAAISSCQQPGETILGRCCQL